MDKDSGVTSTADFAKVISKMTPQQHDQLLRMLHSRTTYLAIAYEHGTPVEFVKAFYEAFDECMADSKTTVSCKKGCYLCCRQNVDVCEAEAALIAEYCSEYDIDIPKDYLREQLHYGKKEVAKTEAGWCTFLKEGECSIYPVRPLACRNYLVASPPQLCDTVKFPADEGHRVAVVVLTIPALEVSAFYGVMVQKKCKTGRLPEMLLKYSK